MGVVLSRLLVIVCALALLSGCGSKTFSNSVAVVVPTPQQVSVFDPQVGDSAEWASQWLGPATPGQPYTRDVPALDTKFIGDDSPPAYARAAIYLPDLTDTGYFALTVNDAVAGTTQQELPFVAWYSETPVPPQDPLPVTVEMQPGPNGWLINIVLRDPQ